MISKQFRWHYEIWTIHKKCVRKIKMSLSKKFWKESFSEILFFSIYIKFLISKSKILIWRKIFVTRLWLTMPYLLLFKPLAHIATVANMNLTFKNLHMNHSSQSHGLCLIKYANETLQNLSYFMYYENPKLHFCYSFILY